MLDPKAVRWLIHAVHNTSPQRLARKVYGRDADDGYIDEKAARIVKDPLSWICTLDATSMRRLLQYSHDLSVGYYDVDYDNV